MYETICTELICYRKGTIDWLLLER